MYLFKQKTGENEMNASILTTNRPKSVKQRVDDYIQSVKADKSYFVTFGGSMRAGIIPLQKRFVTLQADNLQEAHKQAHNLFGPLFAFIFPINEIDEQINRFGLTPINISTIESHGGVTYS